MPRDVICQMHIKYMYIKNHINPTYFIKKPVLANAIHFLLRKWAGTNLPGAMLTINSTVNAITSPSDHAAIKD